MTRDQSPDRDAQSRASTVLVGKVHWNCAASACPFLCLIAHSLGVDRGDYDALEIMALTAKVQRLDRALDEVIAGPRD